MPMNIPYYDYQNNKKFLAAYAKFENQLAAFNEESAIAKQKRELLAYAILRATHVAYNKYALIAYMEEVIAMLDELLKLQNRTEEEALPPEIQIRLNALSVAERVRAGQHCQTFQETKQKLYQQATELACHLLTTKDMDKETKKHMSLLTRSLQKTNDFVDHPTPQNAQKLEPEIKQIKADISLCRVGKILKGFQKVLGYVLVMTGIILTFCPVPMVAFAGAITMFFGACAILNGKKSPKQDNDLISKEGKLGNNLIQLTKSTLPLAVPEDPELPEKNDAFKPAFA